MPAMPVKSDVRLAELLKEQARRDRNPLLLYEPLPRQAAFQKSKATVRVLRGGNRCLSPDQLIHDPIANTSTPVSEIGDDFFVYSYSADDGKVVAAAQKPFLKGYDDLYSVRFSDGTEIKCTLGHQILCEYVGYVSIGTLIKRPRWVAMGGIFIDSVTFLGYGAYWDFHVPVYNNYYIGGVVSHNSGKSLTAFVELARAATGQDPHGKFPTNRPLLIYVVGYDSDTVGRVAYRLLFKPGAYRLITDEKTGKWRAYRPWLKSDQDRLGEAIPAPPLIPPECIDEKGWAWENKAERIFSVCRLYLGENHPMNGTEIRAFGSKSEPAMGDPVDIVMIDEDIDNEAWATEMEARLSDRKGRMWWSAFPLMKNAALTRLSRRAEDEVGKDKPNVEEFVLTFTDNPHIDEETKQLRYAGWTEEERRARDGGEYVTESVLVYPEYSKLIHGLPRSVEGDPDALEIACADGIPETWTRYMSVDPGHTVCAVLFAAVPPPEIGDYIVVYDELYLRSCSASMFAAEVAKKIGDDVFQTFIIDDHGSRVTQAGPGLTIRFQFSAALAEHDVRSMQTEYGFVKGYDNVIGRCGMVREAFVRRPEWGPKLRIITDRCPNLVMEFSLYKKRISYGKNATDQPIAVNNHACDALGYLVAFNPYYAEPMPRIKKHNPVYDRYKKLTKKLQRGGVNLGPPTTPTKR